MNSGKIVRQVNLVAIVEYFCNTQMYSSPVIHFE